MPEIARSSDGGWRAALVWGIGIVTDQKLPFPAGYLELGETGASRGQDLRLSHGVGKVKEKEVEMVNQH